MKARVTGAGINLNVFPVLPHNSLDSVQAEASTFPYSFRREERLKNVGLHLVGNSRTVIANFDYSATVVAIGSDAKLALSVHSVNGVIDEVRPNLVRSGRLPGVNELVASEPDSLELGLRLSTKNCRSYMYMSIEMRAKTEGVFEGTLCTGARLAATVYSTGNSRQVI